MKTRTRRWFPQHLGKASMRNSRLYHTFHKRRRRRPQPNAALTGTGFGTAVFFHEKLPTTNREDRAKEGWLRPLRKSGEASLAGADGVVRSSTDDWKLNEPPRPRQSKERDHLLDGASTPPLPRRGVWTYLLPVSWSGAKREIRDVCSGLLKKALLKMSKLQNAG